VDSLFKKKAVFIWRKRKNTLSRHELLGLAWEWACEITRLCYTRRQIR